MCRRFVFFAFPDNGEYEDWSRRVAFLNSLGFKISVVNRFENKNFPKGTDLADLYISAAEEDNFRLMKNWKYSDGSKELFQLFQKKK